MKSPNYFKSNKITNSITRIQSISGEYMYLIEGDNRAALIDTGIGLGDLETYIKGLTSLPITVILTHGHLDHVGGVSFFKDVYLSKKDKNLYQIHVQHSMRKGYLDSMSIEYDPKDFAAVKELKFKDLNDNQIFDLGGINIQVLECPGHTLGSVMLVIKEERTIIFGDDCNNFTFMFDEDCPTLTDYKNNLLRIKKFESMWDKAYLFHGSGDAPKTCLDDVINLCDDIIANNVDNIPFQFMGRTVHIAKAINSDMSRLDGKFGNIVYDINRIK